VPLLLLALACATEPAPPSGGAPALEAPARTAEEVRARCEAYAGTGEVAAYCAYRLVSSVESVSEMADICGTGGPWSVPCRTAWVEPRLHPGSGVDAATLLRACGEDPDCRLDVLDHRPQPLRAQLDACAAEARENLRHCVSHAVARWREAGARVPTFDALLADPGPAPALLGEYLAESVVCDHRGSCGGPEALSQACEARSEALRRDPHQCRRAGAPGARPRRPKPGNPAAPPPRPH
jgi:hypothetical protein